VAIFVENCKNSMSSLHDSYVNNRLYIT